MPRCLVRPASALLFHCLFFYRAEGGFGGAPVATSCSVGTEMWRSCGSCRRGSRTCWQSSTPGRPTITAGTGGAVGETMLQRVVGMKMPRAGKRWSRWPADESRCRVHYSMPLRWRSAVPRLGHHVFGHRSWLDNGLVPALGAMYSIPCFISGASAVGM